MPWLARAAAFVFLEAANHFLPRVPHGGTPSNFVLVNMFIDASLMSRIAH